MFGLFKRKEPEAGCMSCNELKPVSEFDRTWIYEGRTYGYCFRCNGKGLTPAEHEARLDARRSAQADARAENREREQAKRDAMTPEELQAYMQERRDRRKAKEQATEERKERKRAIIAELNEERAREGLPPIDEKDIRSL